MIDIQKDIRELSAMGLMEKLLADKTTGRHILWATDAYETEGESYGRGREIELAEISLVKTRARKAAEQQSSRTRRHGEVFTPRWVCDLMNDALDRDWFGVEKMEPDVWEDLDALFWQKKGHKTPRWQRYVDSRRLEITCGEAPYLAERYDVSTGEEIEVSSRRGLLDRKLLAISHFTETREDWQHWALRAVEATYGYEFQGDNLLIARVNIMKTVMEHYFSKWEEAAPTSFLRKMTNKVAWNLWQMDGLSGRIPYCAEDPEGADLFSFGDIDIRPLLSVGQPVCRVYSWRSDCQSVSYEDVKARSCGMRFDYIVGNPPYQEETTKISKLNGQLSRKNIFHLFQMEANHVANKGTELIYPGGRWIHQSGKGMKEFGRTQINDPRLSHVTFYANANEVFTGVAIADGVSIVSMKMGKKKPGFRYTYIRGGRAQTVQLDNPGENLISLNPKDMDLSAKLEEFISHYSLRPMFDSILPRSLFGIESDFVSKHQNKVSPYLEDMSLDYTRQIKILTNDKAGKSGRAKWFVADNAVISNNEKYIHEWQVVVSSANAGGQKRDRQLQIIDNHSAFGRVRVALASFQTKEEAENFYAYVDSYIIKYAFLLTDEALSSLGKKVPDLLDYHSGNSLIDFSKNIDLQLKHLLELTEEEFSYMKERVIRIRGRNTSSDEHAKEMM